MEKSKRHENEEIQNNWWSDGEEDPDSVTQIYSNIRIFEY